jgi:hypothetical protein
MGPIDYGALFDGPEGDARAQAQALAQAIKLRRDMGTLGGVLGGPYAGAGKMFEADAQNMDHSLQGAQQFRAQAGQRSQALLQSADQFRQEQNRRAQDSVQSADQHAAQLALQREQMNQDNWSGSPDPSGGVVLYNRKTGEVRRDGGPAAGNGPHTPTFKSEDQSKSFSFTERIREARKQMDQAGYPQGIAGRKDAAAMGAQSGPISSLVPQEAASEPGSRYFNASRNLVAALLRKESGAAISNDEWKQFTGLYIPMPWDSPEAKQNKLRLLDIMEKSMAAASGPSANAYWAQSGSVQTPGTPPLGSSPAAPGTPPSGGPAASGPDAEAKVWAQANPADPRSAAILSRLGVR